MFTSLFAPNTIVGKWRTLHNVAKNFVRISFVIRLTCQETNDMDENRPTVKELVDGIMPVIVAKRYSATYVNGFRSAYNLLLE